LQQVIDEFESLLICHKDVYKTHIENKTEFEVLKRTSSVIFIKSNNLKNIIDNFKNSNFIIKKYLDKFNLVIHTNENSNNQIVYDKFFEFIAPIYEKLIDIKRNENNINNLLSLLLKTINYNKQMKIIDFGCGSGLSHSLSMNINVKLIGLDRCPLMRKISKEKGMDVWGYADLIKQPFNSINAYISSYVFHLFQESNSLKLLWKKLMYNGTIIANFHKNQGIDIFISTLKNLGGEIAIIDNFENKYNHGKYLIFKKE